MLFPIPTPAHKYNKKSKHHISSHPKRTPTIKTPSKKQQPFTHKNKKEEKIKKERRKDKKEIKNTT